MLISSPQSLFARGAGLDVGNFLFLFCGGLLALFIGCGLLVASRAALIGMSLFNAIVILNISAVMLANFPGLDSGVNNLALYLTLIGFFGLATLLPLLPRIRAWFRLAGKLRSDHTQPFGARR